MIKTTLLGLPIYDNPSEDKFKLTDWNVANQNIEMAFASALDGTKVDLVNSEVIEARGGEDRLSVRINKIEQTDLNNNTDRANEIATINQIIDLLEEDVATWKAFKAGGGVLGSVGAIRSYSYGLALGKDGVSEATVQILNTNTLNTFCPNVTKVMDLGLSTNAWRDAYIGNYSLQANGYTKLPNGLILQWGSLEHTTTLTSGSQVYLTITFPIAFPGNCLQTVIDISGEDNSGNILTVAHRNFPSSKNGGSLRVRNRDSIDIPKINARWFAIGY